MMDNIFNGKKIRYGLFFSILMAAFLIGRLSATTEETPPPVLPGSEQDPLISKAYFDAELERVLTAEIKKVTDEYDAILHLINQTVIDLKTALADALGHNQAIGAFEAVYLTRGQVVIGAEETEIILRAGNAVAFSLVANGLSDLTQGAEVFHENEIHQNHHLLTIRDDGRGIRITSHDAWVLIRGRHTIMN
jgi:hypothetical protein